MPFTPTINPDAKADEIRGHLESAATELIELRNRPADKRDADFESEVKDRLDFIRTFDPVHKLRTEGERAAAEAEERQRQADELDKLKKAGLRGPSAAGADLSERARTPGAEVVLADGYEDFQARGATGLFTTEVRALLTSGDTDDLSESGLWRPVGQPIPPRPRQRRLFVRDLLSVQNTGLSSVPYIKELNAATNETGADAVMEGSAKPEATMQFEDDDAPIRKIAAWIPATTEILADAPTLRGYIDNRLAYMVLLKEEQQVLKGTGNAPQVRGIYNTTGTQTQSAVAGDVPATIAASYGKIENVDGDPDAVVMNPLDFWGAISTRHSTQFDNGFGGNAPAEVVQGSLSWGERVVRSRALDQTECLVGAFGLGATLFEREGVSIRVGDQHGDYFVYNKVAILAEERVGLAVHRPDWFVETTLDLTA
jgi:HK97 family phage major capsid protein